MKPSMGATLLLLILAGSTAVGAPALDARFALHRKAHPSHWPEVCTTNSPNGEGVPCTEYTVTGPLGYNLVYMVVGQGPGTGINTARFGIEYDGRENTQIGIDPRYVNFIMCANGIPFKFDGGFGEFPAPKGSLIVTWVTCENTQIGGAGVHAVIGALDLYAYSVDVLRIVPFAVPRIDTALSVTDCVGETTNLLSVYPRSLHSALTGRVQVGGDGTGGYTPCGVLPAVPMSWGRLKSLY